MKDRIADDSLPARTLRRLQRNSFDYFIHEVNRANGLVLDKTAANWPASIAAMGMALTVYIVGAERGFIDRKEAADRSLEMLRFLADSEQGEAPDATGFKGFYYHFLRMDCGRREWRCELSSIDTALLIAGVLASATYFDGADSDEAELRELARFLYERVDWTWMLNGGELLSHGWTPEKGFLRYRWEGYDEALILYLLALGSPTYGIGPESYSAWCRSYSWKKVYGIELLHAGPLFIHQMSHIWCDFRGIRDPFMREHDCDYFENSRRATLMQYQYAIRNPRGFSHVGKSCWGITASDGPGNMKGSIGGVDHRFFGYTARGVPFGPDDGTISPWAVAASLPFAPEIVAPTITHFMELAFDLPNPYGFKASFNPIFQTDAGNPSGWVSPFHFGINEGPTVLMIENHRSDLIWELMHKCVVLKNGLKAAGFSGGWIETSNRGE
ncbi:MAG: glucoamylase family protein [Casimicrobiaceae bacterium]